MRRLTLVVVAAAFCALAAPWPVPTACALAQTATTKPLNETDKIERLIATVENLTNAVFIRNGQEHDARGAAKHMRDKWNAQKDQIRTAEEFIDKAASRSSVSGKPYLIRFKDGREIESAQFLRDELKKLQG